MPINSGESLLDHSRPLETDGVVQLNDVYGLVDGRPVLDDVDASVETVVGNLGGFASREYRVDAWPDAMTYLGAHIVEVRDHQSERLRADLQGLGYSPDTSITDELVEELRLRDRKVARRAQSVGQQVVEVISNHAPRTTKLVGENGSTFYAGVTENGVIFYSQEQYLRDLQRDGRIIELHRVKTNDNNGLWPDGHQFRSAEVANTRSIPGSRELLYSYPSEAALQEAVEAGTHDYVVAEQESPIEIVWIDKFGNSVLRFRDPEQYSELLAPDKTLTLVINGQEQEVKVGETLDKAQTGKPTIFKNPKTKHPKQIDLAIKSEDCLSGRDHALEFFRNAAGRVALRDLRQLQIDLKG